MHPAKLAIMVFTYSGGSIIVFRDMVSTNHSENSMAQANFVFYGYLGDLLPKHLRQQVISYPLNGPSSVKHPIEALGVPHTEVNHILLRGKPIDFSYQVKPGDAFHIYPAQHGLDRRIPEILRPALQTPPRFILDSHLGRLASYMRLMGFDVLYRNDYDDEELAQLSGNEQRVLLTRDRRLLMRKAVVYGYCLRTKVPRQQLLDVLERYELKEHIHPWRRCIRCNGQLSRVPKHDVLDQLEPKTKKYYHEFKQCQGCQQIYWKGSHFQALQQFIEEIQ